LRVLYDAQIFRQQRYGGISRYFCELATRLAGDASVTARIVAPHYRNEYLAALPAELVIGWPAARFKRLGKLSRFAGRFVERRTTARLQPDVIHETYFWGPLLRHDKAQRVLTVYDMIHERFASRFSADDPTPAAKRNAVARADHVVCISESTRHDLIETLHVPEHKVSVIYLSASIDAPARGPVATSDEAPYLLYVGDRGGYKNFLGLVAAVGASPLLRDLRITCFGGGALTAAEWEAIDRAGVARERIAHAGGGDDELARLYSGALAFVYPSLYEGFGLPPLEAMACDCPVVCSRTSSIPEVVGDAGEYFDPADLDSMRAAIERVAGSGELRESLRRRGRAQRRKFSWDRCAEETLALYRRLDAGSSAQGGANDA
jgi:glycosyltransferase involved in cell wall biosynthesis